MFGWVLGGFGESLFDDFRVMVENIDFGKVIVFL